MSKEIAQTVGGKKFGLMLALLAALAVLATLGSQWQKSEANVTPADATVVGPFTTISGTTAVTSPAPTGTSVFYRVETVVAGLSAGYSNPVSVKFTFPTGITPVAGSVVSGPAPVCDPPSGQSITCTWASLNQGSVFSVAFQGTTSSAASVAGGTTLSGAASCPATEACASIDDASVQAAQILANGATTPLVIYDPESLFVKSQDTSTVPGSGGQITYTLTFSNPTGAAAIAIGAANFTDSITDTDIATVDSVTPGAGYSCTTAPATLGVAPPVAISCQNTAAIAAGVSNQTAATIVVTVGANPSTTTTRSITNTAIGNTPLNPGDSDTVTATQAVGAAAGPTAMLCPGLYHVDPFGKLELGGADTVNNCTTAAAFDVDNNVIGYHHEVCLVPAANTDFGGITGIQPPNTAGNRFRIDTLSGTPNVLGQILTSLTDATFANGSNLQCVTWYSTQPGEQSITVVNGNGEVIADHANGGNDDFNTGGIVSYTPLVKEWNTLIPTTITASAGTAAQASGTAASGNLTNLDGSVNPNVSMVQNPSNGTYTGSSSTYYENVLGTHTNAVGTANYFMIGANVTFTWTGTCGAMVLTDPTSYNFLVGGTTVTGLPAVTATSGSITLMSVGKPIPFKFITTGQGEAYDCSVAGDTTGVSIQAAYPAVIGSQTPVVPAEKIQVTWTIQIPIKKVLLAWAGQRVIVEQDWRVPAGDANPVATCPFSEGQTFAFVRSANSPGNFVPALGGTIHGNDEIDVTISGDSSQVGTSAGSGDAIARPQDACITRAQYESEDPGEVDIEHFPTNEGATGVGKVAFVIYYMKLNNVTLSLATQVSKPSHNGVGAYADWAPGNPWDATKDATGSSADWNVSKDILVRGRVTGWFINSNPSGRARDDSNKQNVLPADRWVMPDDWVNIAGGSALASSFRPSYDLMFDPDNTGLALGLPYAVSGTNTLTQIAAVAANSTGKGNGLGVPLGTAPIIVTTAANIKAGDVIVVGATQVNVCAVSGTNIVVSTVACTTAVTGLVAAPAPGTLIYKTLSGYPFIGPYSLIDVPGFSGTPGAALENDGNGIVTTFQFRDTTQGDLKVDWWDAPMPPAETTVTLSGTGFLKQVLKEDVYYNGVPNTAALGAGGTQTYPNPYYYENIPASPYLPAVASGGGYSWNSWGNDGPNTAGCLASSSSPCNAGNGPYHFWQPFALLGDTSLTASKLAELNAIRTAYGTTAANKDLGLGFVVYSDNHGEFMVAANGDFRTDLTACATNVLAGGKQCKPGDKVGVATISAVADYPDFVKHFPVASNAVTVNWTWGGYKDVTIEKGETDQYSYVVFHGMDRDGFCGVPPTGAVLLHPLFTSADAASPVGGSTTLGNQVETVDFLIDSGSGIILSTSGAPYLYTGSTGTVSGEHGNVIGVPTYSVAVETAYVTGKKTFPVSALAASGQTDECQAWIKVSNSLLGVTNVLAIAHDDEGNIGFDKVIDFQSTMSYTLNFRWSLITWNGADNIPVADALKGGASTKNPAGNDISASVTAVYGWDQAAQQWLAFFPTGVNVPGANNLTALKDGSAYWIAITGPGSVTWTVSTNVS